ncbi:Fc.00g111660.m01.CDS01 [Cosmosporella sp. VM-42]
MPSATARRMYEDQIPPFMTVFDLDAETMADQDTVTLVDPKFAEMDTKTPALMNPSHQHALRTGSIPLDPTHKHHDSMSTQTSESAESSPTTTLSTTDSSPLSDPSPSSSPDSPINLIPLNNFPSTTFSMLSSNSNLNNNVLSVAEPIHLQRPMTSPSPRRARNMKGLSIQPPFATTTSTISLLSEPSSPSFIKPKIQGMKRKPSQLSLKTNTSDLITKTTLEVPPSPAMPPILQRRALKHSTSSPHMLSGLKSSTFGPVGGMTFPKVLERNESGLSEVLRPMKSCMKTSFETTIAEEESPIKTQLANRSDLEPYQENENNEDLKTPGYPDGPIAIYGDNVYLYLEPTAEEASKFDVVINVAREVKNPFEARQTTQSAASGFSQFRQSTPADESPIPDTAVTCCSFTTAFEYPPADEGSAETPTTPKAMSFKTPEYIHIPWDHNTDIAPDLMNLCETIDSKTKEGKKVLVHCQQGASRSASLIIAYGLYQKPELSVNDAYYAAQAKSRWISPNMKLMYSLQDFQKEVSKKRPSSASRPRTGRSPTKHRLTLSADAIEVPSQEQPHTAPLPKEDRPKEHVGQSPNRPRGNSTPGPQSVSPGPASAPPTYTWMEQIEQTAPEQKVYEEKAPELLAPTFRLGDLPKRPKSGQGRAVPSLMPSLAPPLAPSLAPVGDSWSKPPPSPGFPGLSHASFGFQTLGSFPRFTDPPPKKQVSYADVSYDDQPGQRTIDLPLRYAENEPVERMVDVRPRYADVEDEPLLSPRAETMTNNPLHEFPGIGGMRFVESPPTPSGGLFSPRAGMFPRDPFSTFGRPPAVADPRSPPTKGEAPIVRSIDDLI